MLLSRVPCIPTLEVLFPEVASLKLTHPLRPHFTSYLLSHSLSESPCITIRAVFTALSQLWHLGKRKLRKSQLMKLQTPFSIIYVSSHLSLFFSHLMTAQRKTEVSGGFARRSVNIVMADTFTHVRSRPYSVSFLTQSRSLRVVSLYQKGYRYIRQSTQQSHERSVFLKPFIPWLETDR